MKRPIGIGLSLLLLLACQGKPGATGLAKAPKATPKAVLGASVTPSTGTSAGPRDLLADVEKLRPPAGSSSLLSGTITIDASYIVAGGGGNVISHNGSAIVAGGGGNLIGQDGASLIGQDGAGIVAGGGGNIVAAGGGNIVAAGGGNIVAGGGGNIVAAGGGNIVAGGGGNIVAGGGGNIVAGGGGNIVAGGGGNIVAGGGGNIVAGGGGNFRLLADAFVIPSSPPQGYGTLLPAVGLLVWVKSLGTGLPISLGQDQCGFPVWAVYSNLEGKYELHLPPDLNDNVMVVAEIPFQKDRRMGYGALAGPRGGANHRIDEDSTAVTRYLRQAGRLKFDAALAQYDPNLNGGELNFDDVKKRFFTAETPEFVQKQIIAIFTEIFGALKDNTYLRDPAQAVVDRDQFTLRLKGLAEELGDLLLSDIDLDAIPLDKTSYGSKVTDVPVDFTENPSLYTGLAKAKLEEILKEARIRVAAKVADEIGLAATPDQVAAYFAQKPYIRLANEFRAKSTVAGSFASGDKKPYEIKKPSDLTDFVVLEYLARDTNEPYGCKSADCPTPPPAPIPAVDPATGLPCDEQLGCITETGIKELRARHIKSLVRHVFADIGMDPRLGAVLSAANNAIGAAVLFELVKNKDRTKTLIMNYNAPPGPDVKLDCQPPPR